MSEQEKTKLDLAYDSIENYDTFVKQNSLQDDEKVDIKLHPKDSGKKSTVKYDSPEGSIKVTYNPMTKQAVAQADFVTGKFKAVVEEDNLTTKGQAPVFHCHWSEFNDIFTKD